MGVAILFAVVHARACGDGELPGASAAHHSSSILAAVGNVKPRRSSISANLRTTLSAKRSARYLCRAR